MTELDYAAHRGHEVHEAAALHGAPVTEPAPETDTPETDTPETDTPATERAASELHLARRVASGRRDGVVGRSVALRLVDVLGLAAAVIATGRIGLPVTAYALGVLAVAWQPRVRICLRVSDQVGRIFMAAALPLPFILPWVAAGRAWRLALLSAAFVTVIRALSYGALRAAHRRGHLSEPTLVVGAGEMGVLIADALTRHPELGLRPLGFLDAFPQSDELPLPVLGSTTDLPAVIARSGASRVIVCFPVERDRDIVPALRACRALRVDICLVPRLQEVAIALPRAALDEVWGIPLIPLRRRGQMSASLGAKRALDVLGAAILLAVLWPALLVLAIVIRRSGRPAFFRQVRVTGDDRTASIIKLRTLEEHSDADRRWTVPTDGCTAMGQWLRASHVDELPQLVNVLRGEMSLVGPRPERPYFAERFGQEIPRYHDRNRMRAGLTGWAQVHGLHGDTSMPDRVRFDNQYIESWSLWLDVVILARTLARTVSDVVGGRS
jgi:exopolysaccharide biosynthesis polyprenyl glycosylphosphotransferase